MPGDRLFSGLPAGTCGGIVMEKLYRIAELLISDKAYFYAFRAFGIILFVAGFWNYGLWIFALGCIIISNALKNKNK